MKPTLLFDFTVDKENSTVNVKREFAAEHSLVWDAWTKPEMLDKWWAPKPYVTKTKSMNFTNGGRWLYAMEGPTGDKHWCLADYSEIDTKNSFKHLDAFCDLEGNISDAMPRSAWSTKFTNQGETTLVNVSIKHDTLEDLEKIIEMGFKEGFTMAMGNLDELFSNLK
ncbi:SRPBCC domain-containing protein [Fulvivirga sp.]|uniref:SRPBCC family protein n=1 Tax=Fulvivirga sp. TaxID=1931237 RepID=UPI0032EE0A27